MNGKKQRVLFLYSELAQYFMACADSLSQTEWVDEVSIVHWPVNPEAPFQFKSTSALELIDKSKLSRRNLKAHAASFNPTAIVCSGWMDSDYNAVARDWQKNIPVILSFDNWWTGSLKQRLAEWISPLYIKRCFNRAWIPGTPQREFAERLNFSHKEISEGFYCADPVPFHRIWDERVVQPPNKKLLFVGRYLPFKGVQELCAAFINLADNHPEWELHCIGTGAMWKDRAIHPKIIHHGFVQPDKLQNHIVDAAAFVMPSIKEPWGVVLHEMAIAGLPILCSNRVGAASRFLKTGMNGFCLEPTEEGIQKALLKLYNASKSKLKEFGERSRELGTSETPERWVQNLNSLL